MHDPAPNVPPVTPPQSPLPASDESSPRSSGLLLSRALSPDPDAWDELRDSGRLRSGWEAFARQIPLPPEEAAAWAELQRRRAQLAQQIARDGVTHNVFADGAATSRPWSLELLPLIIEAHDWSVIEAGVVQRAALLEAVLADVYGPQHLFREGLLPPALVMRHPGYLRPLRGVVPPAGQRLHLVAFDLARGVDGAWWVVAQHTQGPSGLGYVLHNRLLISRQFPDAFRELRVQHLASGYRRLLDTLEGAARQLAGGQAPRVVLLTPGPYSETYFEHAFLARYLGLTLAEGGDLTVRGEQLFLKTVEGLERVHGVLRRLDDDYCDPLELRPDSALGVPGLLQAVRAGTVAMANALGSAFLESPAVAGFLPGVAERLLGQPLALPSIPTWWCGEQAAWDDVKTRLHDKRVCTSFPSAGRSSQRIDADEERVREDPGAWTVQSRLRFSRAPIIGASCMALRPALVRVYVLSDLQGRWHMLPGGMTRVAQGEDADISMQQGGSSLDTWVRTEGVVDTFSMLKPRLSVEDLAGRAHPVASRTGENLFWLGRYTERTEQLVRLARATLMLVDADADAGEPVQAALSELAVRTGLAPWGVPGLSQAPHVFERAVLQALADAQAGSVAFNLAALGRSSVALRERLSPEQWGLIRSLPEGFSSALQAPPGQLPSPAQALPALDQLALQLAALTGLQNDRMTRDHGWRLLAVGRLLERLHGLTLRLEAFLAHQALDEAPGVDVLLELFDSTITFRARYQRRTDLLALVGQLVLDTANPRAFAGVLRRLRTELGKLPGDDDARASLLEPLPAQGAGLELQALRALDDAALSAVVLDLTRQLGGSALELAGRINARYFTLQRGLEHSL